MEVLLRLSNETTLECKIILDCHRQTSSKEVKIIYEYCKGIDEIDRVLNTRDLIPIMMYDNKIRFINKKHIIIVDPVEK